MAKKSFYEIGPSEGYLRKGSYLEVRRQINYRGDRADFKPFLNVPVKDLEKQLKESQAEEKKVFEEMKKAVTAWDEHGAQTLLLQKAIEYLKTPEVTHTRNEWQRHKDGSWEISNLVYKMTFNIVKSGDEWKLTWELSYTAPGLSQGYWGYTRSPRERIEYEGSKKYKTMEGAQKYIQSKFDQYAPCFESLSPPIPAEAKELFCVNGQLLQGYSLQPPVPQKDKVTLEDLFSQIQAGEMKNLNVIVKADVQGSAEAVKASLEKLTNEEVRVRVIHCAVGAISESDVMLATTSNAIIVGFNVRPDNNAKESAARNNVDMRMYRVIYDCINEIETAMKGMLAPKFKEVELGQAEVRNVFRITGVGMVAGCYVTGGKMQRGAQMRLLRDNIVIYDGAIASLQRFKDSVKEVAQGYECGITFEKFQDIKEGDVIEAYLMEQIEV